MTEVIEKTENKKGYKKTKLGWIPEDWINTYIGKYVDFIGGSQPPKSMFKYQPEKGYIRLLQIRDYKTDDYATYIPEQFAQKTCNSQDVMIGRYGPPIFQILRGLNGAYNVALMKAIPNEKFILKDFLFYVLQQEPLFRLIDRLSARSCGQTGIDIDALNSYPLLLPSIIEQKRIVETIKLWELAIETLEKLIEQKEVLKNSLAQKYFHRKNNLFSLKQYKLGELFKNRKETNCCDLELLSVCDGLGIVPRSQLNAKDNSNEDKSKYLKVCVGDLAYNTMRMWQGRCGVSAYEGIVSPAYTVCIPKDNIDVDYMYYLFKTPHMIHDFWRYSQGIVDDTLNLKFNNFEVIKVWIPDKETQTKIAKLLKSYDEEIQILNSKLEKLKEQKKGLMQKLLTGQIRVQV